MKAIIEKFHAKILDAIMDIDLFEKKAKLLNFEDSEQTLKTAYIKAKDEENLHVVFNLPILSNKIFITISDGDPEQVAAIASHLEEIDALKSELDYSHVVRFNEDYFLKKKKIGVIILPVAVSPSLKSLSTIYFNDDYTAKLHLIVFITADEYECWKNEGQNHLMERFEREGKDLVCL
jgi:hypothetical protein